MENIDLSSYIVNTFEEIPMGALLVKENSNYFYIEYLKRKYITTSNLDFSTIENIDGRDVIVCQNSYYNVINGEFILNERRTYSLEDNMEISSNINPETKIIPLSHILNPLSRVNSTVTLDDIDKITNTKTYSKRIKYINKNSK